MSIALPGDLTKASHPVGYESTSSVTYTGYVLSPDLDYLLGYFDLTKPVTSPDAIKQVLEVTCDRIRRLYTLNFIQVSDISKDSYPGKQVKAEMLDLNDFMIRVYLVKQRVYILAVAMNNRKSNSGSVSRFFDSFTPTAMTDQEISALPSQAEQNAKVTPIQKFSPAIKLTTIRELKPNYPKSGRDFNQNGKIVISMIIAENGRVILAKLLEGDKDFALNALSAVLQNRYQPTTMGGKGILIEQLQMWDFSIH